MIRVSGNALIDPISFSGAFSTHKPQRQPAWDCRLAERLSDVHGGRLRARRAPNPGRPPRCNLSLHIAHAAGAVNARAFSGNGASTLQGVARWPGCYDDVGRCLRTADNWRNRGARRRGGRNPREESRVRLEAGLRRLSTARANAAGTRASRGQSGARGSACGHRRRTLPCSQRTGCSRTREGRVASGALGQQDRTEAVGDNRTRKDAPRGRLSHLVGAGRRRPAPRNSDPSPRLRDPTAMNHTTTRPLHLRRSAADTFGNRYLRGIATEAADLWTQHLEQVPLFPPAATPLRTK